MTLRRLSFPSILNMVQPVITDEHTTRIMRIDSEDYSDIIVKAAELVADKGIEPSDMYLVAGITALKQYYALALLDPANAHAISAAADPFWHAHMLFSERYERFCKAVVGDTMHHTPFVDRSNENQLANLERLYRYSVDVLNKLFGATNISSIMWPAEPTDVDLICLHKGNQDLYPELQSMRLFEPTAAGQSWAFA